MRLWLFVLIVTVVVNGEEPKSQPHQNQHESRHAVQSPEGTSGGPIIVVNEQPSKREEDSHPAKPPSYLCRLLSPENLPNIALVIVAAITAWYVAGQSKETAKATQAMRDSLPLQKSAADAALLNAKAVIHAERPWVVIMAIRDKSGFSFRAGNRGKTPAEVISFCAEQRCVEHIQELPAEPEFTQHYVPQIKLLVPGQTVEDLDLELTSSEEFLRLHENCLRESSSRTFPKTPKLTVFYFRVVYAHVGGQLAEEALYESRTCFCFNSADAGGNLRVCGNLAYNRHT